MTTGLTFSLCIEQNKVRPAIGEQNRSYAPPQQGKKEQGNNKNIMELNHVNSKNQYFLPVRQKLKSVVMPLKKISPRRPACTGRLHLFWGAQVCAIHPSVGHSQPAGIDAFSFGKCWQMSYNLTRYWLHFITIKTHKSKQMRATRIDERRRSGGDQNPSRTVHWFAPNRRTEPVQRHLPIILSPPPSTALLLLLNDRSMMAGSHPPNPKRSFFNPSFAAADLIIPQLWLINRYF